jgi:hypothetical protein
MLRSSAALSSRAKRRGAQHLTRSSQQQQQQQERKSDEKGESPELGNNKYISGKYICRGNALGNQHRNKSEYSHTARAAAPLIVWKYQFVRMNWIRN